MEGFIFIGFLIFLSFIFSKSNSSAVKGSKQKGQNYEVPEALRNKWKSEDQAAYGRTGSRSTHLPSQSNRPDPKRAANKKNAQMMWNGQTAALRAANETAKTVFGSKSRQKQLDDSQDRNAAQTKSFARSGDGQPKDKNFNRRDDWGHRGAGKTALAPFLTSALIAAAIAVFFMSQ